MWDLRPEAWTTFWTWATYFVTDASTPTVLLKRMMGIGLGTRQKSAIQCSAVRIGAAIERSDGGFAAELSILF